VSADAMADGIRSNVIYSLEITVHCSSDVSAQDAGDNLQRAKTRGLLKMGN
jgi:hypothetical protein